MSFELVQSQNGQVPIARAAIADRFIICTVIPQESDGRILRPDIIVQTRKVFENLDELLRSLGSRLSDVLHVTVYLTDISNRDLMTEVWQEVFSPLFPARATIGVNQLAHPDLLIEVTATAFITGRAVPSEEAT